MSIPTVKDKVMLVIPMMMINMTLTSLVMLERTYDKVLLCEYIFQKLINGFLTGDIQLEQEGLSGLYDPQVKMQKHNKNIWLKI